MKYIVIIGDGMADWPLEELGGLTPLQKALTPNMDTLAKRGIVGRVRTIPDGFPAGSDVANLSILGYDPREYYSGRAPLEAASMGIELDNSDVAYRCNLVTLDLKSKWETSTMNDYSAGHITNEEAHELVRSINEKLGSDTILFYPGISYRHLMVWKGGNADLECTAPHDITGNCIDKHLPKGNSSDIVIGLMKNSLKILREHTVNKRRIEGGKRPANSIWLWGQGKKPSMPDYNDKYGLRGAIISAVDLTKGLGVYAGFEIINVPGATGYIDTNYKGKAEYAIRALEEKDFVYLHIEAPDEAGHIGNINDKIKAIEDIDSLVVGPIVEQASLKFSAFRILLMPDHATPIAVKTHTDDYVPFVIYEGRNNNQSGYETYSESIAGDESIKTFKEGYQLMDFLIQGS